MKPLKLKISGLNSFRETQEIDFEQLSDTGVFGIFGPTGSGKSSILDALTLALYGTVERATNNTQGILNHAEESLAVQLTFTLGTGDKRKLYRAERSYRRSGDKTVKASTCRLVQIMDSEETVLTNKAEEMGKKIKDILGLTIEDFTRAVVLPQGKFAEFLTIKPRERREMLERLFALETYGRELSARLSTQQQETTQKHIGVDQRQQGLGDASDERLARAEVDLNEAIYSVAGLGENFNILKHKQEKDKEVWALQEQFSLHKEKQTKSLARQTMITTLTERLDLAERAETTRPLIEELKLLVVQSKETDLKADRAKLVVGATCEEKEQAEKKWSEAYQQKTEKEPRLLRRVEQLEQAKSLETEIDERAFRLKQMRDDYKKIDKTRTAVELKLQNLTQQKSVSLELELQQKNRLQEITVEPHQRAQINAANKALDAYRIITKQLENAQKDLVKSEKILENLQVELTHSEQTVQRALTEVSVLKEKQTQLQQTNSVSEELVAQGAQSFERFKALFANIERSERELLTEQAKSKENTASVQLAEDNLCRLETNLSDVSIVFQELLDKHEAGVLKVKQSEQNNLAGLLVESLIEGNPCPVCGSPHHPLPVVGQDVQALEEAKEELALLAQELQAQETAKNALTTKLAVAKDNLLSRREILQNQSQICASKNQNLTTYRELLLEKEQSWTLVQLQNKLTEQEFKLTGERKLLVEGKNDLEQISQKHDFAQQELTQANDASVELQKRTASEAAVKEKNQKDLNQLLTEQTQRKIDLDLIRGKIELHEITVLQENYANWDQELVLIKQAIDKLEDNRSELETSLTTLNTEKNKWDLELKVLETAGREAGQIQNDQVAKLHTLTEGRRVAELFEVFRQELETLVKAEETNKALFEHSKTKFAQAEQDLAVLTREKDLKKEELNLALSKLEEGLKTAQFLTVALAEEALCGPVERREMAEEIRNFHQECSKLHERLEEITTELAGRSLSPEDWLAWTIRLEQAEKAYTEAVARRGATEQVLLELKERHIEWVKLEALRQSLSHRLGLLKTLQTIFKGNTFVEFIAEEQLVNVALDASERLGQLTNYRYALEVDSEGGFIIRDDANGGYRRPVSSLSGGETFLTSLALALALSTQIQLRGESPLEFFFLDEGFGTLDTNLLEVVMDALERLRMQNMTIGIISHVPELKNRLARRLIVTAAEPGGVGSKIKLERA